MNKKQHCCVTVYGERVTRWACQRYATVERKGKWYCTQHDPEKVKARNAARHNAYEMRQAANARVDVRATELGQQLGCADPVSPHFNHSGAFAYTERLIISYADAERLIARLAKVAP